MTDLRPDARPERAPRKDTMQHTPGPWRVEHTTPGQRVLDDWLIVAGRGLEIALLYTNDGADDPEWLPAEANARLIAAAPDLLAAAKHAAMEWRLHGQLTDSCRVLEAAIQRATDEGTP